MQAGCHVPQAGRVPRTALLHCHDRCHAKRSDCLQIWSTTTGRRIGTRHRGCGNVPRLALHNPIPRSRASEPREGLDDRDWRERAAVDHGTPVGSRAEHSGAALQAPIDRLDTATSNPDTGNATMRYVAPSPSAVGPDFRYRSTIMAMPMPPPMHMVIRPVV